MKILWMEFAYLLAEGRSSCQRFQVGCVITDADFTRSLSLGYNGSHRGGPNQCDAPTVPGGCGCLHAEDNAIAKLDYREPTKVMFVTAAPCKTCAKRIINAGITKVYFADHYRHSDGIALLKEAGIPIEYLEEFHIDNDSTNGKGENAMMQVFLKYFGLDDNEDDDGDDDFYEEDEGDDS